jgi:hypothetical protein
MQINNLPTSATAYLIKQKLPEADEHESNKQEIKCKTVSKIFPSKHSETNENQAKRPVQIKQKFFFPAA